jgi:hypothetical protein
MRTAEPSRTDAEGRFSRHGIPALRVRLALHSDRWFKRAMNGLRAVHQGLWLGLFRAEDIAQANSTAYARWDRYLSADYNRSGFADWERDAVVRHFPPDSTILVASAGAGREVLGLERLGYHPVGFDPSFELVAQGRRLIVSEGSTARLLLSLPDQVPPGVEGPFGGVLVGWGGYIHIHTRAARVSFLKNLRDLVDPNAPMILSFFLRSAEDRSFTATLGIARFVRALRRSREPIELGDTIEGTFDHYFTWDEIESELAEGGFSVVESSSAPYPHVMCRAV